MDKTGEDWSGLHLDKFEKRRAHLFSNLRYVSLNMYQTFINTAGKSFSVVMWPWFCKWKILGLPIWRLELTISKIKQNYQKKRDLAPLLTRISIISGSCPLFHIDYFMESARVR